MDTIRLTTAQAIVKWLLAQRTSIDGTEVPVFAGVFGIFGHGNVTSLAEALEPVQNELPTWRGQNEQSMALAATAFGKAMRGRQIMIATSSIGPGSTNMVTAAAVANANRIPLLLFSGDTFQHRIVDPVLQQIEVFGDPTVTVTDAFRPVSRYWDRITRPEQIVQSLPQALAVMLDPATRGPAFIALPQDIQAEAYDYPASFFEPVVHYIRRPGPDPRDVAAAAALLAGAERPLIIAGGGVHYSGAVDTLTNFAADRRIPVVETVAGKATLISSHPNYAGPIGVTGSEAANAVASDADVVLAIGTRLQGLHDRVLVRVQEPRHPLRGDQYHAVGRPQAPRTTADRRRQVGPRSPGHPPRRLSGARGVARERPRAHRAVACLPGFVEDSPQRWPPGVCASHSDGERPMRPRRLLPLLRRRAAG